MSLFVLKTVLRGLRGGKNNISLKTEPEVNPFYPVDWQMTDGFATFSSIYS
jgi:hypothetical protein